MAEVMEWIGTGDNRILMCGMVGARRGWKEAPLRRGSSQLRAGCAERDQALTWMG